MLLSPRHIEFKSRGSISVKCQTVKASDRYLICGNSFPSTMHLSSSRFFRSTSGLFWWDGNPDYPPTSAPFQISVYIHTLPSHQYNLECCKNFCTKIFLLLITSSTKKNAYLSTAKQSDKPNAIDGVLQSVCLFACQHSMCVIREIMAIVSTTAHQ